MKKTKEPRAAARGRRPAAKIFAIGEHRFQVPGVTLRERKAIKGAMKLLHTVTPAIVDLLTGRTAVALLKADNRELKRQVKILRAELRVQEAMWKDTAAGKFVRGYKATSSPKNRVVKIDSDIAESGARHAKLALDQARRKSSVQSAKAARGDVPKARRKTKG